jgi:hypothetical protein
VTKASRKHARPISFRSERHRASKTKGRKRSVTVLTRTTQEQQVAHDAALAIVGEKAIIAEST